MDHYIEPKRAAQFAQLGSTAFSAVAKTKIGSFMDLDRSQRITNDNCNELSGPHARELGVEIQHQDSIYAGFSQELKPCLQGGNEFGAGLRPQKTQRMGIKCNRYRAR